MLIVHLKKKQIRVREMEIYVIGSMTDENGKQLQGLMDSYRRMQFPGTKDEKQKLESELEQAKRALAGEVDKVFIVRPLEPNEAMPASTMKNPSLARLHARQISDSERAKMDEAKRWRDVPRVRRGGKKK